MLSEQLQKQIEQEGKAQQKGFESKLLATVADIEYCIGAEKYAELLQAAEEKVQRYEKALKEIKKGLNWIENSRELDIIHDALTPKTGEDE